MGFQSTSDLEGRKTTAYWVSPALSTAFLSLFSAAPFGIIPGPWMAPGLGLVGVAFWANERPQAFTLPIVFLLGLFQDLLWGSPVGMWAMGYLVVYFLTRSQSPSARLDGTPLHWLGFAIVVALVAVFMWIANCFYYAGVVSPWAMIGHALMTVAFYPPVTWALAKLRRRETAHGFS